MRLRKIIVISIIGIIFIVAIIVIVTSRGVDEIVDLINKDTEIFYESYNLSESDLKDYQIGGVLFIPYTNHNPISNYDQKYHNYSLSLETYRKKGDDSRVVVNKVTLEGQSDINFVNMSDIINKELEFSDDEKNEDLQINRITLIDKINDYDMMLNKKSKIKVVLNVSVNKNGEITTHDLNYIFSTKIRKYLVQP